MKKNDTDNEKNTMTGLSRRKFISTLGATTAGLLIAPSLDSTKLFGRELNGLSSYVTQVAVTQTTSYDRTLIKQKVKYLFDSIGGIGEIFSAGKKVGIKVNLTGGNTDTDHMCTNPEVLRAVTELIIAQGVINQTSMLLKHCGQIGPPIIRPYSIALE